MTGSVSNLRSLGKKRIPVPLSSPWFWAIAVLFVLVGLIGHDPWKQDDAIGFGIAWTMANGTLTDWLIPNVAGQMVPEEGPLAFWWAALSIKLLGGLLHAPDAARLATALWTAVAIYASYRAARAVFEEADARLAVLALLACLGLTARAHEIAAEPALIAASACLLWSLSAAPAYVTNLRTGVLAALGMGTALAMAALARGLPAGLVLLVAMVLLPTLHGVWRAPRLIATAAGALVVALVAFTTWTRAFALLVEVDGPAFGQLYGHWLSNQFGWPGPGELRHIAKTLAWFTFPLWPIVLWWLARRPRVFLGESEPRRIHIPALAMLIATLLSLGWTRILTESSLLPLLPAGAVLAAPAVARMARGMAAAIDWFGRMTFTLAAGLIWLGYLALYTGWPPRISANFYRLEPGFLPHFMPFAFLVALAATLAWLVAIARSERTVLRAITHWAYGVTLSWLLLMTLWLPWIDYGKSYRSVAVNLKAWIGATAPDACIEARNLGLAERASFAYFLNLPYGVQCHWIIEQSRQGDARHAIPGARFVWEGQRPGERNERFRLYKR